MTGNQSGFEPDFAQGGGIFISPEVPGDRVPASTLSLSDSIVAGNFNGDFADGDAVAEDVDGRITESNGANVFGTAVTGNRSGDLEGSRPPGFSPPSTRRPAAAGSRSTADRPRLWAP